MFLNQGFPALSQQDGEILAKKSRNKGEAKAQHKTRG